MSFFLMALRVEYATHAPQDWKDIARMLRGIPWVAYWLHEQSMGAGFYHHKLEIIVNDVKLMGISETEAAMQLLRAVKQAGGFQRRTTK